MSRLLQIIIQVKIWIKLLRIIETIGLPKGSYLRADNLELPVGSLEGLALYVNGVVS